MFAIIAVPFEAHAALPRPEHRWLLTCFSRYVDCAGAAFPSLRQLAKDARMSLASVCRRMTELEQLAVFQRQRQPGGRYRYVLAEAYRPRWPGRSGGRVSGQKQGVSQSETSRQVEPAKHKDGAPARRHAIDSANPKSANSESLRRVTRRAQQVGGAAAVVASIEVLAAIVGAATGSARLLRAGILDGQLGHQLT